MTAGVTTLATLAMPVVIGAGGLAFDLNRGYEQRMVSQRAADMAALGAAMAYNKVKSEAILDPTAQDIVLANGLAQSVVDAELVNDYPIAGSQAVKVTIDSAMPYMLSSVLGFSGTFNVQVEAYAPLSSSINVAAPCYLALSTGASALTVTGGASIVAPTCTVAAVGGIQQNGTSIEAADVVSGAGSISVNYGSLIADSLRFAGSFSAPAWNGAVPPAAQRVNQPTNLVDPWEANMDRVTAVTQIGDFTALPALANPTTPNGSNWNFNWSPDPTVAGYRTSAYGNTYVVPPGNYTIGRLEIAGGINVVFQNGSNITIRGGFKNDGNSINFGDANLYVNGGFNSGSSGVTIGDGDLWIGSGGSVEFKGTNLKGDGSVIINNTVTMGGGQSMVFGAGDHAFGRLVLSGGGKVRLGAGNLQVNRGIDIAGDSDVQMIGDGDVLIGRHTDDHAIKLSGSARLFMGDGTFSADGHIDTQGGSRLVFGRTGNHLINGNMNIRGSVLFGRGRYTINGNYVNGTGGTTWPYTSNWGGLSRTYGGMLEGVNINGYDMAGIDVTFILSGTLNLGGGAKTRLEAPDTNAFGGIAELLLSSQTTSATSWGAGSGNVFAGAVHLPRSALTMSGGNSTVAGSKCFSLIALTIAVNGGAQTGTACESMSDAYLGG